MSKTNICIVGLSNNFTKVLCNDLAKKLDMFYANISELIEFELMDVHRMEEVCGLDYLLSREKSVVKRVCTYDNTLMSISFSHLNNQNNLSTIKSYCLLIYIRIDFDKYKVLIEDEKYTYSEKNLNIELYGDRDKICIDSADIVVDCKDLSIDELSNKILFEIKKYYKL